ncbi:MAG: hypothetical protein FWB74_09750 [Defluviitaleaceae bacterium]|nr:hypothetical protein [Defluviitaleaceae bacterium]
MRKFGVLLLLVAVMAVFVGCTNEREQVFLGIGSMHDTELGVVISIGDTLEDVRALLGEEIYVGTSAGPALHLFENGMNVGIGGVDFLVFGISAANDIHNPRFEIKGHRLGMTREDVFYNFTKDYEASERASEIEGSSAYRFRTFFDREGNVIERRGSVMQTLAVPDVYVQILISWGGTDRMTIDIFKAY